MPKRRTYKRGGQSYYPSSQSYYPSSQPSTFNTISSTASLYGQKAKQSLASGFNNIKNWFSNLGASSSSNSYMGPNTNAYSYRGGRRRRFKTRRVRRAGGVVNPYTSFSDIAVTATPVHGYNTAQPHNWVGGKKRRNRTSKR